MWFGIFIVICLGLMIYDMVKNPEFTKWKNKLEED